MEVIDEPSTRPEPTRFATRFANFRRVIVFLLGMAVIIDALWDRSYVVPELIVGMVLVGVVPLDELLSSARKRPRGG